MEEPVIRETKIVAKIGKLEPRKIYPVTEDELSILEQGQEGSLFLNFAIAILSIAISATLAYFTLNAPSYTATAVLVGVMFAGYPTGLVLLIVWYKSGKANKDILARIRKRIEAEKIANNRE